MVEREPHATVLTVFPTQVCGEGILARKQMATRVLRSVNSLEV